MSKKIGVVTIHTTFNYGAVLQAYATVLFFRLRGFDAELVDYTNPHIQEQLKLIYKQDGKIKGYFITFIRNTVFGRLHYYHKAIKNIRSICPYSERKYKDLNELNTCRYDILVAGSDQLWNPQISEELDPAFFLQFGDAAKRISMASSAGSYKFNEKERDYIKEALQRFDAISVREQFVKDQIQDLTDKDIKVLLDPTLLINKQEWWDNLAKKSKYANIKDKYIVTYFAGGNKNKHRKIIAEYAAKMNLPVWTIQYSNYTWKESSKKILGASIEDFVALIANAQLVITDSFHGTVFSLNMETNFVALMNTANPVRVKAILDRLEISDRIDMAVENYHDVDYTQVTPSLNEMRQDSVQWVMDAVSDNRE